jgi:hypothetical protein
MAKRSRPCVGPRAHPWPRKFFQIPLHRPIVLIIFSIDANATDQYPRDKPALLQPHRGKAGDARPHSGAGNLAARPLRTPPGCPRRTCLGRIHPPHHLRSRTLGVHRGGNPTPPPLPLAHRPRPEPRHASPRPYHVHRPAGPSPRSAPGLTAPQAFAIGAQTTPRREDNPCTNESSFS